MLQEEIQFLIKVTSLEESGLIPEMVCLILKRSLESPTSTHHYQALGQTSQGHCGKGTVAKFAAESLGIEPTACVASFASVIQGRCLQQIFILTIRPQLSLPIVLCRSPTFYLVRTFRILCLTLAI